MPHKYHEKMFDIKHLRKTAEKLKNWGRWGPDDQERSKVALGAMVLTLPFSPDATLPIATVIQFYLVLRVLMSAWAFVGTSKVRSKLQPGVMVPQMRMHAALQYADFVLRKSCEAPAELAFQVAGEPK